MSAINLRLVYDAEDPPAAPRHPPQQLASTRELEPCLRRLLHQGRDGELLLRGPAKACVCLFESKIAWIRLSGYPEHLGHVMRRELGLSDAALRQAITHCQTTGLRFGEGLVELGLVRPSEVRDCLHRHMSDQLWEVMAWPGALTMEHSHWPHRYDHAYTFELDELMTRPSWPSAEEQQRLSTVIGLCLERLPGLELACVIEAEEGTVLYTGGRSGADDEHAAEDLLSLCTAGLRRLAANRITRHDGAPEGMVFNTSHGSLVVKDLPWHSGWLLVLGGKELPGRIMSVAVAVSHEVE